MYHKEGTSPSETKGMVTLTVIIALAALAGFIVAGFIVFAVFSAFTEFEITYRFARNVEGKSKSEARQIAWAKFREFEDAKSFFA